MQPQSSIHPTLWSAARPGPAPVLDGCLLALLAFAILAVPIGAQLVVLFGSGAVLVFAARRSPLVWPGLFVALAQFLLAALAIGIRQGDRHVVGLFAGLTLGGAPRAHRGGAVAR